MKQEPKKRFLLIRLSLLREKYELRDGEKLIAELQYPKWYSEKAIATLITGKKWEFIPRGILKSRYDIREYGYENSIAFTESSIFKQSGVLKLPKGKELSIKVKFFSSEISLIEKNDAPLFTLKRKFSLRERVVVRVWEESPLFGEFPWLIVFGCYLSLQDSKHSSGVVHT